MHRNGSFALQQLKPFKEASRFCKPQISTHKQQIRTIQLNPLPRRGYSRRPSRLFLPPCGGVPVGSARITCCFCHSATAKKRRKAALFIQLHRILPFQPPSTLAKLTKCTKNSISPLTEPFFCVILSPTKKEMHKFISSLDFNERMAYHMRFSFQSALCFDRMFRPGHEQCVGLSLCRSIG